VVVAKHLLDTFPVEPPDEAIVMALEVHRHPLAQRWSVAALSQGVDELIARRITVG
jgi:hypothetical protein